MIKDIKYNGYTATPSDHESPDGDLATSLNLINEDGALQPVPRPVETLRLTVPGERIILIHSVHGQKNLIILRPSTGNQFTLHWLPKDPTVTSTAAAQQIGQTTSGTYRAITAIGNTLILSTSTGINYILWRDSHYLSLYSRPPFPVIDFGMYKAGTLNEEATFSLPARAMNQQNSQDKPSEEELARLTQAAYGMLLRQVGQHVTSQGNFYQPFFIRYALRLYDGSYNWHSAPILMLPTVIPPTIICPSSGDTGTVSATLRPSVPYFSLAYRILDEGLERLKAWSDIISSIDIFISAPVYTYNQSEDLKFPAVTNGGYIADIPSGQQILTGHYADAIDDNYTDHTALNSGTSLNRLNIPLHPLFHQNIQDEHTFYKVAELPIRDIQPMAQMKRLELKNKDLSSLRALTVLPDDYQSHCRIAAGTLFAFNSRLNLADITLSPPQPFPMRSLMQLGNPQGTTSPNHTITVWTRHDGIRCHAIHNSSSLPFAGVWHNPAANFPRYIYYPDPTAYKMEIQVSPTQKYILNLTPHDFLNGAYWYCGKDLLYKATGSAPAENAQPETTAESSTAVRLPSKIYTSEPSNPFTFPATGINTVGTGTILALSAAVKALSQGQFGQFPLYAFTTEGVWALETNATGGFNSRQPVTRDVCINPAGICQIDSAVLFATDRGIMLLQGASTLCISDTINADAVTSIPDLPSSPILMQLAGITFHEVDIIPFRKFLQDSRMLYDYHHQRIILYNPAVPYAYLYSLKSKAWGMMKSTLQESVPAYPEALALSSRPAPDGNNIDALVDFSQTKTEPVPCVLLTRPIRLDLPAILKTVDTVIQRGNFRKGSVRSILYASRDLFTWHLVRTSRDHRLAGFSGTPYKHYRLALLCSLQPGESIHGATFQHRPRLTNRPR